MVKSNKTHHSEAELNYSACLKCIIPSRPSGHDDEILQREGNALPLVSQRFHCIFKKIYGTIATLIRVDNVALRETTTEVSEHNHYIIRL